MSYAIAKRHTHRANTVAHHWGGTILIKSCVAQHQKRITRIVPETKRNPFSQIGPFAPIWFRAHAPVVLIFEL